jgi:hypothetical protein
MVRGRGANLVAGEASIKSVMELTMIALASVNLKAA